VSDGRIFTAHQGQPLKLVDAFGGEREAVAWLEAERGLPKGLTVKEWKKPSSVNALGIFSLAGQAFTAFGLPQGADLLARAAKARDIAALDGLLAIWHVEAQQ
jgi:protease-4